MAKVHVFQGKTSSTFGFTKDEKGENLPPDRGPWSFFKSIDMTPGEVGRVAVDSKACLEAIKKNGFYIAGATVTVTHKPGGPA